MIVSICSINYGRLHNLSSSQWNASEPATPVTVLNQKLGGWAGYINQGPVLRMVSQFISAAGLGTLPVSGNSPHEKH